MKWRIATVYGILSYLLVFICSSLTNRVISADLPLFNTYMPLWIIFWALIFGIIYIRPLPDNEIAEGLVLGVYYIVISIILDGILALFNISPGNSSNIDYIYRIAYMYLFYPIITTTLGYMANFDVQLK